MATAADVTFLSAKLEIALSEQFLKDITNHDGSGTTVDADILELVTQQALGEFEGGSRSAFDQDNYEHWSICIQLARLIFKKNMNHYSDKDATEWTELQSRLKGKKSNQTTAGQFEAFNDQTTGVFDNDDLEDFR